MSHVGKCEFGCGWDDDPHYVKPGYVVVAGCPVHDLAPGGAATPADTSAAAGRTDGADTPEAGAETFTEWDRAELWRQGSGGEGANREARKVEPCVVMAARPRLLDLFCGAGGAAMGYHRAGFDVVGVDIRPQPNYPFQFRQADALEFLRRFNERGQVLGRFDAIHASPPCQHYANVTRWKGDQADHPDLIRPTRDLLEATGLPYVIENVRTTALRADFMLCGTALGLPIRRHRFFETNWSGLVMALGCQHRSSDYSFDHGGKQPESVYRDAMECGWMTVLESREAIPPAYTEFIGSRLLAIANELRTEAA